MGGKWGQEVTQTLYLWLWDFIPQKGAYIFKLQGYLLKFLLSLVEPRMAGMAFFLGYFHDLLEGGIVFTCVAAQEDIQAGQRLLLLLISSLSCSGATGRETQYTYSTITTALPVLGTTPQRAGTLAPAR